ncbi:hypothetical protein [Mesonia maritima]|uniref:DUF4258 domain-containing protein n=1 Tax=Mesonia maritima TaxID=1793873 RepID=A0ABU1K5Z6_9FLAO|nr:hypothetical protein [Mesonia maritima]MDR6301034.1 hypothetical protein [Mesonia maritima]
MKLAHRLGYYFSGFVIGIIILFFFLSGKKTSCDYGPDARVLKNIRTKKLDYSSNAALFFQQNKIDSTSIYAVLTNGDVDFEESITDLDSCNIYVINSDKEKKNLQLSIKNCDSIATIEQAKFLTK